MLQSLLSYGEVFPRGAGAGEPGRVGQPAAVSNSVVQRGVVGTQPRATRDAARRLLKAGDGRGALLRAPSFEEEAIRLPGFTARHEERIDAVAVRDWLGGNYRSASDEEILDAGYSDQRILVTHDCRTIPPVLKAWAEQGHRHAGVVLVDERTLHQSDSGGLLRALRALVARTNDDDWQDRVVFLRVRCGHWEPEAHTTSSRRA